MSSSADGVGAGGRTRTDMSLRTPDFESGAYTNFATPAANIAGKDNKSNASKIATGGPDQSQHLFLGHKTARPLVAERV